MNNLPPFKIKLDCGNLHRSQFVDFTCHFSQADKPIESVPETQLLWDGFTHRLATDIGAEFRHSMMLEY